MPIEHLLPMENNTEQKPSAIWSFLNSNFGLFICSSVFLTFISWSYNEVQQSSKAKAENAQAAQKLLTEIRYRNILLRSKLDDLPTADSASQFTIMDDMEDIFRGLPEKVSVTDGKQSPTEFTPIFAEFAKRGLISLYWELVSLGDQPNNPEFGAMTAGLVKLNIDLHKLLLNNIDSDALISPQQLANLDSLSRTFSDHVQQASFN